MAGFGGDSRLALLTGFATGLTEREKRAQEKKRQAIQNDYTAQLIKESAARVRNYHVTQMDRQAREMRQEQRQAAQLSREQEIATAEEEYMGNKVRAFTPRLVEQGYTPEQAEIIIRDGEMDLTALGVEDDEMTASEAALARLRHQQATEIEGELELAEQLNEVRRHPLSIRLRRAVTSMDEALVNATSEEMAKEGVAPDAIQAYIHEIWPSKPGPDGEPTISPQQRKMLEDRGAAFAARLVQESQGNVAGALARADTSLANPDLEPDELVIIQAAIEDLRRRLKEEEDAGNLDFSGR
jgi:hypothetical protein